MCFFGIKLLQDWVGQKLLLTGYEISQEQILGEDPYADAKRQNI